MKKMRWNPKFHENDKFYGSTTMGARGQVVIPAEARKDLGIKPGDRLLVMGKFGKALGLIKSEQLTELAAIIMKEIAGTGVEGDIQNYFEKILPASRLASKSKPKKSN